MNINKGGPLVTVYTSVLLALSLIAVLQVLPTIFSRSIYYLTRTIILEKALVHSKTIEDSKV